MLMGEPSHYRDLAQVCSNFPTTRDTSNRPHRQRFLRNSSNQTLGVGLQRGSWSKRMWPVVPNTNSETS